MKAELEFDFPDARSAKRAAILLQQRAGLRSSCTLTARGRMLRADVRASDFTALRAVVTSLLRELRVVFDSLETINNAARQDVASRETPDD